MDNTGKLLGLEQDFKTLNTHPNRDGYEQFLIDLIKKSLGNAAATHIKIRFCTHEGKEICVAFAERSHRPVYVEDSPQPHFYLRVGNTTQELVGQEALEYIKPRFP